MRTVSETTGKRVAAHPTRVAQADQLAAAENAKVILNANVPPTHLYVIDLDEIMRLPEFPAGGGVGDSGQ